MMLASSQGPVLRLPGQTHSPRKSKPTELLAGYLALRYVAALDAERCAAAVDGVYAARPFWTSNFGGVQFTMGRAWYTHLEEDREDEYFENVATSDATFRRFVPGLQEWMMATIASLLGKPSFPREGWAGPGIHIFPAGSEVARVGGEVHFDNEGLTEEQIERRTPALSWVLMLQPPESGGGLGVWDRMFEGDVHPKKPGRDVVSAVVPYEVGDLVVIDSYRMHQIQAFGGKLDRVSMTAHTVEVEGGWEVWF